MNPKPLALLVNDSLFSYQLARETIDRFANKIRVAIISTRTTGSRERLSAIFRKASKRYLIYRSLVQIAGYLPVGRDQTVIALCRSRGIPLVEANDVNDMQSFCAAEGAEIGVAFNFDQILKKPVLDFFPMGVINAHASRLPHDRGISPALWSFARGDAEIWVTLYQMDEGLDTGPVFEQFSVPVLGSDSAFTLYLRVCQRAGRRMAELLQELQSHPRSPDPQAGERATPFSWPDSRFDKMLRTSGRKLMRVRDLPSLVLESERDG